MLTLDYEIMGRRLFGRGGRRLARRIRYVVLLTAFDSGRGLVFVFMRESGSYGARRTRVRRRGERRRSLRAQMPRMQEPLRLLQANEDNQLISNLSF